MVNSNKRMGIISVPFSRLLKLELPELAEQVIRIVEKHDPEELQINEIFQLLVDEQPQIDNLEARYGVHPLTLKLKPMREKLLLKVSSIKLELKLASKTSTDETKDAVTNLQLVVDRHLLKLRKSKNEAVINRKITQFLNELSTRTDLQTAVSSLGLTPFIDDLKSAHKIVREMLTERLALKSLRPKDKTKDIAKSVESALEYLFKQIEVAQLKHTDLDYQPLFDELNDTSRAFRNSINIRVANNKRKADEKKGIVTEETIEEDDSKESDEPIAPEVFVASARGMMIDPEAMQESSNGDGLDADSEQSLDHKKTAAPSTRPSQPSSTDNEKA